MIKKMLKNNLIRLGFFNSISVVIKIVASIVSSKALALFVGPSGLGLFGIFKEFFFMTMNVSSLGLQKGIIKYASELKDDKKELKVFISTIFILGGAVSILLGFLFFIFSKSINDYLFSSNNFSLVIKILALILPLSVFSNLWIFLLNGLGYSKTIVKINILLYVLNMVAVVVLSYKFNTFGALCAISLIYIIQLFAIMVFKPTELSFKIFNYFIFSKEYLKKLIGYTIMTITSLILFPYISILIRQEIISLLGKESAGFWEAMKRISENYLLFASSLILLSVLPKLSENESADNFRNAVFRFYKSIIPFFVFGLLFVFILKDFIVRLFFSNDFMPMNTLFKWYLLGDIFRILGMVLAANFYARRLILSYILTDMFLAFVMYFSTMLLLKQYGLDGGGVAYLLSYLLYFILLLFVFGKKLFNKING